MIFVAAISALGENVDQTWSDVDGIEDEKMSNFFRGIAVGEEMNGGMEMNELCRNEG